MSDQSDVFQYLLNESPDAKNADLFSFGPPPQPPDAPSPELFDQDVDQDVAELDLNLSFDDFLSTVCDNVPAASTLPALTYSTDSCYEIASSLDFYINAPSVPLMPSEIETVTCGSVNDGSYTTHGSIYSPAAVLSDGLLPFPPANTVTAQSDCGTSYVSTSIPVHVPEYEVVQVKAPSDYGGSVNDGPYTTHDSIYSPAAVLSDGLLPFPPANPVMAQSDYETSYVSTSIPVHLPESDVVQVKAQSDYVTSYVSTSIPVHVLDSEAAQVKAQSGYETPDVSISPPVHVPSSKVAQTAKNKRFKCTECSYSMLEPMRIFKWLTLLTSLSA